MLPGIWLCDEQTRVLRRLVSRRTQLVHQRTRAKNQIHAVLIRQLEGRAPERDLFAKRGRAWLQGLELPDDERQTVDSCLREADFLASEIALIDRQLAERALRAATLMACIGDIRRFPSPRHLVGYVGLAPKSRQSGSSPARHGHISKEGSASARHVLVEAAHSTQKAPGPLRAFAQRIRARRGASIATVAVARKLCVLAWHMLTKQQDYIYERPALTARKLRKLELATGAPRRSNPRGSRGPAGVDNPAQWKRERAAAIIDEARYIGRVENWKPSGPNKGADAAPGRASSRPSERQAARQETAPPPAL